MRLYSNKDRPHHLGSLALERLRHDPAAVAQSGRVPADTAAASPDSILESVGDYATLFATLLEGKVAPAPAPVPDDLQRRADNMKASAYFLDATLAGCCAIDPSDWLDGNPSGHRYACVFLIEFGREPRRGDPGELWIRGTNAARTDMRAAEVASILAGYVRWLGHPARGHAGHATQLDLAKLAVRAGLARVENGALVAPFLKRGFRIGAVTTDYAFAADTPLAAEGPLGADAHDIYMGVGGTRPGWHDDELDARPLHMGRYPMEQIKRADEPTTLIVREEIQRVSKRGDFFGRALAGDLGEKAKRERRRFPMKHPLALGMQPLIQNMVPLQGTRHKMQPNGVGGDHQDEALNAQAIKALGYYLGADFVGICEAEPWMYYSHNDTDGAPLEAYHRYAVVMLIDQGFETMEGASGDDRISASQSMRGYLRGAEVAGVMASHCRRMGYSSRVHSNAHSEFIHNPGILMAGLGEVSRIGDTLLNPFIGPRSKSIVFTTDFPMETDRPIDFGLQDFCEQCHKCARECPCNAIPFGPKVMFNGYEIWKADVEKCTKYRVTQEKGSACGRCMKMCPWNREDTVEARRLAMLSIEVPASRAAIIATDDAAGNGTRNLIKRWWFDLEVVDGRAIVPPAGTNERDNSPGREAKLAASQKLAMFPPKLQPPGGTTLDQVVPIDRVAGLETYARAESPEAARRRIRET